MVVGTPDPQSFNACHVSCLRFSETGTAVFPGAELPPQKCCCLHWFFHVLTAAPQPPGCASPPAGAGAEGAGGHRMAALFLGGPRLTARPAAGPGHVTRPCHVTVR